MAKLHKFYKCLSILVFLSWPVSGFSQTPLDSYVQGFLSSTFATASLMSDSEVIKFGIWNFNPNDVINVGNNNLGSAQSTELRQSLRQFSLPFRWQLTDENRADNVSLVAKLAYIDIDQDMQFLPSNEPVSDQVYEQVYSAGVGLAYTKPLDEHWELKLVSYLTYMRYHNEVDFNTTESQVLVPYFDGVFTNIKSKLLMFEPSVGIYYNWSRQSTHYQLFSNPHYMVGRSLNADNEAHEFRTEAWYWSNGFAMKTPFTMEGWSKYDLWIRLARTDMGGDLDGALGDNHYYEAGIGWLVDTRKISSFFENVGFGININYGSVLRGGTIIFMYNFSGFR